MLRLGCRRAGRVLQGAARNLRVDIAFLENACDKVVIETLGHVDVHTPQRLADTGFKRLRLILREVGLLLIQSPLWAVLPERVYILGDRPVGLETSKAFMITRDMSKLEKLRNIVVMSSTRLQCYIHPSVARKSDRGV